MGFINSFFGFFGGFFGLYRVVPPNEIHVRVLGNSKCVFMSRDGKNSSYWVVPFITRLVRLPANNIRIDVPDVKLNDSDMAKFMCDIVCFVNIKNPELAAERTSLTAVSTDYEGVPPGVDSLSSDFRAIMESIGRTVATKQTILDIYKDRSKISDAVTKDVGDVFPKWGLELVNLEIRHIKDIEGSTIISDIERKQAAVINADARVKVATENNRAAIIEAERTKDTQMRIAETEQEWKTRQTLKEQAVAVAVQERNKTEALKASEANAAIIEARRKSEVGGADVEREAIIKRAEGEKQKLTIVAEGVASKTKVEGLAEADIIQAKKFADAAGTEKQAVAQQKFNDAATTIEAIKATKEVQLGYALAYQKAFENAKVNVVAGSASEIISGGLLGSVKVGAMAGMSVSQFLDSNPEIAKLIGNLGSKKE